jgi:hypothetical protein
MGREDTFVRTITVHDDLFRLWSGTMKEGKLSSVWRDADSREGVLYQKLGCSAQGWYDIPLVGSTKIVYCKLRLHFSENLFALN